MNQLYYVSQKEMKYKQPITILAIVAVSLMGFLFITNFLDYTWSGRGSQLAFQVPKMKYLISGIVDTAPSVLFAIYVLTFHKTEKTSVLMPVIFGSLVLSVLYDIVVYWDIYLTYVEDLTLLALYIVGFSLAMVDAIRGFSQKIFLTVGLGLAVLLRGYVFLNSMEVIPYYLEEKMYLYLLTFFASAFGFITSCVGLWLFGWYNTIVVGSPRGVPVVQPNVYYVPQAQQNGSYVPQAQPNTVYTAPQQPNTCYPNENESLTALRHQLEFGMITEEEFQEKQSEIMKNL